MQPLNEPNKNGTSDPNNAPQQQPSSAPLNQQPAQPVSQQPKIQPITRTDFTATPQPSQTAAAPSSAPTPSISSSPSRSISVTSADEPSEPSTLATPKIAAAPTTPNESSPAPLAPSTAFSSQSTTPFSSSPTAPAAAPEPAAPASAQQPGSTPTPAVINSQQWFQSPSGGSTPPDAPGVINGAGLGTYSSTPQFSAPKRSLFPKPVRWALLVLLVIALAGGYAFGIYIPNKPENVYKTGLNRTGIAIDKLTTTGTQKSNLEAIKKVELSGGVTVEGPGGKQTGSFSSHYDDKKSDSTLTYKTGGSANNFSVQALTDLASGQTYPDIYFKVTGLSVLGLDQYAPELVQYDGKWINISPAFMQSVIPPELASGQTKSQSELTPQDAAELTKAVVTTTREYVFTNDPNKTVLVNRSFKGKETIEAGIKANRYEVGIDKAHAKSYCKALITNVMATNGFKHIPGVPTDNQDDIKTEAIKSCNDGIDSGLKDSDTFDMWVNASNKLISKVRFTGDTDTTTYVDIGQTYTGGNTFPAFMTFHSGKDHSDAKLNLATDFDKNSTKLDFNGTFGTGADKWTVKATAAFKPFESDLKITKPTGSVSIEKVLQTLGIDPTAFTNTGAETTSTAPTVSGGIQAKAKDTERVTDLRTIQGQMEAYYAQNGMYPKLEEINDASWRNKNMKGLDPEALADPDGQIQKLASSPSVKQYGYLAGECDVFNGCQTYSLSAIQSDGTTKTFSNMN